MSDLRHCFQFLGHDNALEVESETIVKILAISN